jgi:hypothetical protein
LQACRLKLGLRAVVSDDQFRGSPDAVIFEMPSSPFALIISASRGAGKRLNLPNRPSSSTWPATRASGPRFS